MILSDITIKKYLKEGRIKIDGIKDIQIQPASIDLTLGNEFLYQKLVYSVDDPYAIIRSKFDYKIEYEKVITDECTIAPGTFILATTNECVSIDNGLAAWVEGRSSIGRIGLFIHNAGWIDPGWNGKITLELFNASRYEIKIVRDMRICQIIFAELDKPAENPYCGKYQNQSTVTGSMLYKDEEFNK